MPREGRSIAIMLSRRVPEFNIAGAIQQTMHKLENNGRLRYSGRLRAQVECGFKSGEKATTNSYGHVGVADISRLRLPDARRMDLATGAEPDKN